MQKCGKMLKKLFGVDAGVTFPWKGMAIHPWIRILNSEITLINLRSFDHRAHVYILYLYLWLPYTSIYCICDDRRWLVQVALWRCGTLTSLTSVRWKKSKKSPRLETDKRLGEVDCEISARSLWSCHGFCSLEKEYLLRISTEKIYWESLGRSLRKSLRSPEIPWR